MKLVCYFAILFRSKKLACTNIYNHFSASLVIIVVRTFDGDSLNYFFVERHIYNHTSLMTLLISKHNMRTFWYDIILHRRCFGYVIQNATIFLNAQDKQRNNIFIRMHIYTTHPLDPSYIN